jgi:uncharacterized membrane protein
MSGTRETAQDGPGEGAIFEAVIVPHRSLSPLALRLLLALLLLAGCISAGAFWLVGAWPVAGFSGVEIPFAILLLSLNARGKRATEVLLLDAGGLRIRRTDSRGRHSETVVQATWLNVVLEERRGAVPRLWLATRGVREEVAASLGEAEKRDLADQLAAALHRWRNPHFDNPQLREE